MRAKSGILQFRPLDMLRNREDDRVRRLDPALGVMCRFGMRDGLRCCRCAFLRCLCWWSRTTRPMRC
jgi:hypothetical protein